MLSGLSACSGGAEPGRDATSAEVTIGERVWMGQNLDVDSFRNGDPIPHARTDEEWAKADAEETPAWCYFGNDSANGRKYGRLYNWHAVADPRGLAPEGWSIPSDADWNELAEALGGTRNAGKVLKSSSGWKDDGNGTNESGFTGRPGGARMPAGGFVWEGQSACFWSSTDDGGRTFAWTRILEHDDSRLNRGSTPLGAGFSVRCIKDSASNP